MKANIIKNLKKKLAVGVLACLSLGAASAATVTVNIPAAGGTVSTSTISNEGGYWYFDGSTRPSWVTGVVLRYNNSSITVGTGTMTFGTLKQGYFNVTAAKNTGAARSWTWNVLSAKGGSTVTTLVIKQAAGSTVNDDDSNGNWNDWDDDEDDDWDDDEDDDWDDDWDDDEDDCAPITFAVSASQGTYTSYVSVSWKAGTGAKSYKVYRSTTEDFDDATLLGSTAKLAWTDKSVTAGTKYWYFVRAIDANGVEHENEKSACGYAKAVTPSCPKPTATDGSYAAYVKLTWTKSSGVSKYYVFRGTTTTFDNASCIGYSTSNTAYDKTATLGVKYYYWICPAVGSSVYVKKSAYDAGFRKVTISISTPKTLKVGKTGKLTLKVNGQTLTRGSFKLSYSSAYLQVLSGTGTAFAQIKGKKAGTAKLTLTYGTTAAAKVTWTINVTR